jgi:hypothetical protein
MDGGFFVALVVANKLGVPKCVLKKCNVPNAYVKRKFAFFLSTYIQLHVILKFIILTTY